MPDCNTLRAYAGIDAPISGGYSKNFPRKNAVPNVVQETSPAAADFRAKVNTIKEVNKELTVPTTSAPSTHSGIDEAISGGYSKDFPGKKNK